MKKGIKTLALVATILTMSLSPLALAQTTFEAGSSVAKHTETPGDRSFDSPGPRATDQVRYRDELNASDYTWMSLSSLGLGAVGAALGSYVLIEANSGCQRRFLGCIGPALLGGTIGVAVGAPLGAFVYGEAAGFDGRYLSAFGGAVVGGLTSGLLLAAFGDDKGIAAGLSLTTAIAGPLVGSVLGYTLSVDTRPSSQPRSASLLDFNPADGLRLSVPAIGFTQGDNDTRLQVSVLSGTF